MNIKEYNSLSNQAKFKSERNKDLFFNEIAPILFTKQNWYQLIYHYSPYTCLYRVNFKKRTLEEYRCCYAGSSWCGVGENFKDFFDHLEHNLNELREKISDKDKTYRLLKKIVKCIEENK